MEHRWIRRTTTGGCRLIHRRPLRPLAGRRVASRRRHAAGCLPGAQRWGARTWSPHSTTRGPRRSTRPKRNHERNSWRGQSPWRALSCTPPCAPSSRRRAFSGSVRTHRHRRCRGRGCEAGQRRHAFLLVAVRPVHQLTQHEIGIPENWAEFLCHILVAVGRFFRSQLGCSKGIAGTRMEMHFDCRDQF